jgi:hypothetical protein
MPAHRRQGCRRSYGASAEWPNITVWLYVAILTQIFHSIPLISHAFGSLTHGIVSAFT